jgi:hypothetical protein
MRRASEHQSLGAVVAMEMSELTERVRRILAPLTEAEERRAIEVALASGTHRLDDPVVRGVELAVNKPGRRGEAPSRHVRVVLTGRNRALAHEFLLDSNGAITGERRLGPINFPYTSEEIEQARAVAVRDDHVARQLVDRAYGLGTFGPSTDEPGHRLVGLHFVDVTDPNIPQPIVSAVVDLATDAVVHEPNHEHDHGESGGN